VLTLEGSPRYTARFVFGAIVFTNHRVKDRFIQSSLSQQFALVCATSCLVVSLALVALAGISGQHLQESQQSEYGNALANQIARRISTSLETGDLLKATASLQRFVETSSAEKVAIFDVEGRALGQAGSALGHNLQEFNAPVLIEDDVAGEVVITISTDAAAAARSRFLLSLIGLAILLSLTVYAITLQLAASTGRKVAQLARTISLEDAPPEHAQGNELTLLTGRVDALPMDLLRTRSSAGPKEENYQSTAVLYLHLASLSDYVATLDEHSLHRYTDKLHQVVYAAAGFYAGELNVVRQFGLAVYFTGENSAGSAAFRAASCAWLIRTVSHGLEKKMSLTLGMGMAVGYSELGAGDGTDIYPGLYMQSTLDELQLYGSGALGAIHLNNAVCNDVDVTGRLTLRETDNNKDLSELIGFQGPYDDLLERQLRLILRRLDQPI